MSRPRSQLELHAVSVRLSAPAIRALIAYAQRRQILAHDGTPSISGAIRRLVEEALANEERPQK